jgi:uncharacterized membrane protein YhhN
MNKIKIAFIVFLSVAVLDVIGVIFQIPDLRFIFKPLILLSLLVLYSFSVSKRNKVYIMALLFSFFGDVFLLFSGELNFILGLVSFLIAHLLFIKIVIKRIRKTAIRNVIGSSFLFFIIFCMLIYVLRNSLGELLIPVIIYGLTISIFGTVALIDYLNKKSQESIWMFAGALVFVISDSVLAINKFYEPKLVFEVIVMSTYILAEFLIFRSMIQKTP